MAVALSVVGSGSEPLRLDRYRNELAANALGVRPAKINTEGLWILRRLVVVAPDPDSDIVFIPQTRAVNFVKVCQRWVTSEEDIEEEVESQMTVLFFHLAPILQHVPGSHWDFIFDVVENNLEVWNPPLTREQSSWLFCGSHLEFCCGAIFHGCHPRSELADDIEDNRLDDH
jgi:hypothetical protein